MTLAYVSLAYVGVSGKFIKRDNHLDQQIIELR